MVTAAILNHSMLRAQLDMGVLTIVEFHQYWSIGFREITWTKFVARKIIIIITRFVIASNNGWHPRPPIARRAAAILNISKSKSASTHASHHFCKISLSLEHFENLDNFAVSMVTAAILEIPTSKCNSAHVSYYSCKVSSSLQHFDFFGNFEHLCCNHGYSR